MFLTKKATVQEKKGGNADFQERHSEACNMAITRCCLLPEPTTTWEWMDKVNYIYIMERITFSLHLQKMSLLNFGSSGSNMQSPCDQTWLKC